MPRWCSIYITKNFRLFRIDIFRHIRRARRDLLMKFSSFSLKIVLFLTKTNIYTNKITQILLTIIYHYNGHQHFHN